MKQNADDIKCWEFFQCQKSECPAYRSEEQCCWLVGSTFCHDSIQGTWIEKMEACTQCEVFINNFSKKDTKATFEVISQQFQDYKKQVKKKQRKLEEFKTTSIHLLKELDKKSHELKDERDNLEQRVHERTEELRRAQSILIQSTKMAAIGRFSAGVAHEINNPLGAIINFARTIHANPQIQGESRDQLELILKGLFRIENIVKQILSYSGGQKSEMRPTNINQLIQDTISFIHHKMDEKTINVRLSLSDSMPSVFVDPFQIQQVYTNIIRNAVDAMGKNGLLIIETSIDKKAVVSQITDNGKGMSKEDLEQIFDPFFTTKEVGEGTGLGLFICYNILQIYDGTIDINSKKGSGTRVLITLPIPEQEQ